MFDFLELAAGAANTHASANLHPQVVAMREDFNPVDEAQGRPLVTPNSLRPFRRKTWIDAEGEREVTARLEALPVNVCLSEDFPEPLRYDSVRKLLLYRGFMSYGSFRYLRQLNSDPGYSRALDQLFTSSSSSTCEQKGSGWRIDIVVGVVAAAAALVWVLLRNGH